MEETKENNNSEWRKRELGALWVRQGKTGQKYLTGHVELETMPGVTEKVKIVVFSNKGKSENERAPDYVMYRSVESGTEASETSVTEQAAEPAATEVSEEIPAALV